MISSFDKLLRKMLEIVNMVLEINNIITVENLCRNFNGFPALQDVNFTVKEGKIFTYLGPNGAGKSTTINILVTLLKPTSGSVDIAGFSVDKQSMEIRQLIGYLPEDSTLYPHLTVFENLNFTAHLYRMTKRDRINRIEHLLKFFNLWKKKDVLVYKLSKGMKQKTSLARTLVHDPKVLFLDEPTSGLDPFMSKEVLNLVLKLKSEDKTIFVTTHLLSRAEKISDSVALINNGEISCTGNLEEIKTRLESSSLEEVYFQVLGDYNE